MMHSAARTLSGWAAAGAIVGAGLSALAYAGLLPAPLVYLVTPGALVDLDLHTPYVSSLTTATTANALCYAVLLVASAAVCRVKRLRS